MKIELLRKRENFLQIFKDSTFNFFIKNYDLDELTKTKYVINDRLNVIYPINIKRNRLNNLVSEFRYHKYFYLRVNSFNASCIFWTSLKKNPISSSA